LDDYYMRSDEAGRRGLVAEISAALSRRRAAVANCSHRDSYRQHKGRGESWSHFNSPLFASLLHPTGLTADERTQRRRSTAGRKTTWSTFSGSKKQTQRRIGVAPQICL